MRLRGEPVQIKTRKRDVFMSGKVMSAWDRVEITTDIYLGDSKDQLKSLPSDSVDLIITSSLRQE